MALFCTVYLLVAHGSRDPRPQISLGQLAQQVASRLGAIVGTAQLELASTPLHQQIVEFCLQAPMADRKRVVILPLFLLSGHHVVEDIPAEVEQAKTLLGIEADRIQLDLLDLQLDLLPHIGSRAGFPAQVLVSSCQAVGTGRILLAHGSRRIGAQQEIEAIAQSLGAIPAYWAVAPSLATQIQSLVDRGYCHIELLSYFLFEGGISDEIARQVSELSAQFPEVTLHLHPPLGVTPALVEQVCQCLQKL